MKNMYLRTPIVNMLIKYIFFITFILGNKRSAVGGLFIEIFHGNGTSGFFLIGYCII